MAFTDPNTRLTEREIDDEKTRAQLVMMQAQDRAILRARTVAQRAFAAANVALLRCRTEEEVARVEQGYLAGVNALFEAIDLGVMKGRALATDVPTPGEAFAGIQQWWMTGTNGRLTFTEEERFLLRALCDAVAGEYISASSVELVRPGAQVAARGAARPGP